MNICMKNQIFSQVHLNNAIIAQPKVLINVQSTQQLQTNTNIELPSESNNDDVDTVVQATQRIENTNNKVNEVSSSESSESLYDDKSLVSEKDINILYQGS